MWRWRSAIGSGRCVLLPERHITADATEEIELAADI
jgi:hypothetical protein